MGEASSSPSLEKRMELLAKSNHDGGGNDNGNNGDGNDNDSNTIIKGGIRGQGEVIALRTHYPHTSDKLVRCSYSLLFCFTLYLCIYLFFTLYS